MAQWECWWIKWGAVQAWKPARDKNCSNRSQVWHKCVRIYGTQLQLGESEFIGKSSISWFHEEEREIRCVSAHNNNTSELDNIFGKHQPGGTGLLCRHQFLQYAKKPSIYPQGLGRWCSWPFSCNASHVTRIIIAYRPCASKVKGFKTVYQQNLRYIQSKGLKSNPVLELFDLNLSKQITEWQGAGERIVLVIDLNGHPLHNNFYSA